MNKEQIDELIEQYILTGGRRTRAVRLREILHELNGSVLNDEDGATGPTKINEAMVVDQTTVYIKSNGLSGDSAARFFKLELDDFGNIILPLTKFTSVDFPDGVEDANDLIDSL